MARLEDAERGHISRALHRAGSCGPPDPKQPRHLKMTTLGSPRERCSAIIAWPIGANVFPFQQKLHYYMMPTRGGPQKGC